jgi:DNA processing protein
LPDLPGVLTPADPGARAWLAVQRRLALAPARTAPLLRDCAGDPDRVLRALPRPASGDAVALDRDLRTLSRLGVRLVPFSAPAYPWRISQLADPAAVLSVLGDPAVLSAPAVAIVGARAASVYGLSVARSLAGELVRAGLVIVSGLARGIDAAAHEAALGAGGRTIAVQACGPDRVYPRAHRALAARIAQQGAVVTELPPGTPPRRPHFPLRNRLISGLARALVVVEARLRSGSLVTARHALDQGVDVFAVPGPITVPTSEGPNRLLRDGAAPVLEAADILDELGLRRPGARATRPPAAEEPPAGAAILDALRRAPATRDELARVLGLTPHALAPDLLELELEGQVLEDRDGRLRTLR